MKSSLRGAIPVWFIADVLKRLPIPLNCNLAEFYMSPLILKAALRISSIESKPPPPLSSLPLKLLRSNCIFCFLAVEISSVWSRGKVLFGFNRFWFSLFSLFKRSIDRELENSRPGKALEEKRSHKKSSKISSLVFPPKVTLVAVVFAKLLPRWLPLL